MVNMSAAYPATLMATANRSPLPQLQHAPLRTLTKPVFQACGATFHVNGTALPGAALTHVGYTVADGA
jgi:hypothetical protein